MDHGRQKSKKKVGITNFRATAIGTVHRAGFQVQTWQLYKKVFKNRKQKIFGAPRLVVEAKDVNKNLNIAHDEAGHVGVRNSYQNCIMEDSLQKSGSSFR